MTLNELRETLLADGWNMAKNSIRYTGNDADWYAWKRLNGAMNCAENNRPPSLVIMPYRIEKDSIEYESVDFQVTGRMDWGQWVKFQLYGVAFEDVMATINVAQNTLLYVWNAAAAVKP